MTLPEETKTLFQSMREGILIIDAQTKILFANRSYLEFLGNTEAEILGRPLREIRPGARLPEVLSTGSPILHAPRAEKNDDVYFVNMYPILQHGAVTGGISIVTFMRDAYDFRAELEAYEKRSRQVLHRVNKVNSTRYTFDSIVAVDENVQAVKALAQKAAATDAAVLLASESGTGKELYAQAIHNASSRRGEVFVAINCANFNANTLESELFGYVEGAFTGAKRGGKMGLFEAADGGTLFLDEVSEMDMGLQAKLLRVIQEGLFRPVGGVQELETDVRIISASNADLQKYIESGRFRRDLFYRLSTVMIELPPLREHLEDLEELIRYHLEATAYQFVHAVTRIDPEVIAVLRAYHWPGNVRELFHVLDYAQNVTDSGSIEVCHLPPYLLKRRASPSAARAIDFTQRDLQGLMDDYEREIIVQALEHCGYNISQTAQTLGILRQSLQYRIRKYGLIF